MNDKYYSQTVEMPRTNRQGLANAVQIIINQLEDGNDREALMQAVDLLDDIKSSANPYELDGEA